MKTHDATPKTLLSAAILVVTAFTGCTAEVPSGPPSTSEGLTRMAYAPDGASPPPIVDPSFDRRAAVLALVGIDVAPCKTATGPTGAGHVTVTFEPDGHVGLSVVDGGPFPGTPEGKCISAAFATATVPPFSGSSVRVGKAFVLR